MSNNYGIRHGRHCVFKLHVHLVFMMKSRRRVFDGDAIQRLRIIFAKTCANFEAQFIEMDGEDEHVHLLVEYPSKVAISKLVNSLKGGSRRLLRKEPNSRLTHKRACSGRRPTSPHPAAVRQSPLFASTF